MLPDEPPRGNPDRAAFQPRPGGAAPAVTLPRPPRLAGAVPLRVRYAALGLAMGGIWAWNGSAPLWMHAVKLVGLIIIVTAVVRTVRLRRARRRGAPAGPQLSLRRTLGAKAALVVAALAVNWLLDNWVPHAYLLVAVGLAVVVGLLGPNFHSRLLTR